MQNSITQPVFVIGTGRCGLTPMMDLVSYHEAFAWPSYYFNRRPTQLSLSRLSRLVELPLIRGSRLKYRKFPRHDEAFPFWQALYPGFARPFRDLAAADVTPPVRKKFEQAVHAILKYQRKPRFIAEYSGWSRIEFIREIFPDAKFIHIVRDGRAVANSLINVHYWRGWHGTQQWRWGMLPEEMQAAWEKCGRSFIALAGLQWKLLIQNIHEKSQLLPPADVHLVRYEDMVSEPLAAADAAIRFCGLDPETVPFRQHLRSVRIVNANQQTFRIPPWESSVTAAQKQMLTELLEPELRQFNYPL
jgi:hypothetical protein